MTPVMVQILGYVAELREIGKSSNHADRRIMAQTAHDKLKLGARFGPAVPAKSHRSLADLLDEIEGFIALLLAQSVAKQTSEQPDVLAQRLVFVDGLGRINWTHDISTGSNGVHPSSTPPYCSSEIARRIWCQAVGGSLGREHTAKSTTAPKVIAPRAIDERFLQVCSVEAYNQLLAEPVPALTRKSYRRGILQRRGHTNQL